MFLALNIARHDVSQAIAELAKPTLEELPIAGRKTRGPW
jgi:hypothetical protein